jgi:hypothetical protein
LLLFLKGGFSLLPVRLDSARIPSDINDFYHGPCPPWFLLPNGPVCRKKKTWLGSFPQGAWACLDRTEDSGLCKTRNRRRESESESEAASRVRYTHLAATGAQGLTGLTSQSELFLSPRWVTDVMNHHSVIRCTFTATHRHHRQVQVQE